jgi:hypothetical protein
VSKHPAYLLDLLGLFKQLVALEVVETVRKTEADPVLVAFQS